MQIETLKVECMNTIMLAVMYRFLVEDRGRGEGDGGRGRRGGGGDGGRGRRVLL